MVAVVQDAAQCSIAETEVTRLSPTDSDRFAEPSPYRPPLSPALERAFNRHHERTRRRLTGYALRRPTTYSWCIPNVP